MYIDFMALHINNPEVERKVRALASETGETITQTIDIAVSERQLRRRSRMPNPEVYEALMKAARKISAIPRRDDRTPDEVLGYDEMGLPT